METAAPTPLLTTTSLKNWLQVSDQWVRDRLAEPAFVEQCVIDLAPAGSSRRTLRFNVRAIEDYLGISAASTPVTAAA